MLQMHVRKQRVQHLCSLLLRWRVGITLSVHHYIHCSLQCQPRRNRPFTCNNGVISKCGTSYYMLSWSRYNTATITVESLENTNPLTKHA